MSTVPRDAASDLLTRYKKLRRRRKVYKCFLTDWIEGMCANWQSLSPAGRRAVRAVLKYYEEK